MPNMARVLFPALCPGRYFVSLNVAHIEFILFGSLSLPLFQCFILGPDWPKF